MQVLHGVKNIILSIIIGYAIMYLPIFIKVWRGRRTTFSVIIETILFDFYQPNREVAVLCIVPIHFTQGYQGDF